MTSLNFQDKRFNREMLRLLISLTKKLGNLCSRIKCMIWRRPRNRLVVKRLGKLRSKLKFKGESHSSKSKIHLNGLLCASTSRKPIRIATFNAALFAVAPVVPKLEMCSGSGREEEDNRPDTVNNYPRSILKQSISHSTLDNPQQKFTKSKLRVSINLPENEISLARGRLLTSMGDEEDASSSGSHRSNAPVRSPLCFPLAAHIDDSSCGCKTTILEVLREVDADILALQDVKAEEEKGMRPLSDLASALDMKYVFAESWAPEYGNAVLSKWPIRRWRVQKILNDEDIRNVLKATIDIPWMGEVNIYCTQLDYLDEDWRMEQMKEIIQSSEGPHILVGGLNSLDRSDYSSERWTDILKYFEEIGKPKPRDEVTQFLKGRGYRDTKDFAGDCEPVVIIAKGQNVQGTCKYGTRVDYILSSKDLTYKFIPGSYAVVSSKGTSDHHIVKVDITKGDDQDDKKSMRYQRKPRQKIVRIVDPSSSRGIWQMDR